MNKALLLLLVTTFMTTAAEPSKVYTWTDEKGVVHYSDQPHKGAKETVVAPTQQYTMPAVDTSILKATPKPQAAPAWQVNILTPAHEETLRDNDGLLTISVQVQPDMQPGQRLQLFIDGKPFGPARVISRFEVKDVDRGEHSIMVQLIGRDNKIVAQSQPHTIYMHRASIFSPTRRN
ncbi:DUF4124 domain-containing protein [Gallaecimonas mangrovi]|uniref:DUF4124 domain-containing protein n=1 Tax=Gallaecimonas mangrovi TaxID=2291597 RepID=UPI000E208F35|nr:DUF4124 domain-containing protein [Gallaecimonas mangrovi]